MIADYDDLIDDPYRRCEICDIRYHEEYGQSCGSCDIWICNNCWPEHDAHVLIVYRSREDFDHEWTYRASGDCLCLCCGKNYHGHPRAAEPWNLSFTGEPFLHRLCNGELVKL